MNLRVGMSGFSYKEWKGTFYPEKLPDREMLQFYGTRLTAVEINNTFYRMPKREALSSWASQVPDDFKFVIKASRRITHFKRLKEAEKPMDYLLSNTADLGDTLGALLFQLPPNMKKDPERLSAFLELVPDVVHSAFEFRHETWFDESVFQLLSEHNCALVHADGEDSKCPLVSTADWGYLRLRRAGYDRQALDQWHQRITDMKWRECFVFFKHEDEGAGPKLAMGFAARQ
jgi:uncharacterized protein YecE (DUF72 family)|tara:strand:+ start:269 stop:961 length:693 start_codon:yes stop_codon:yes gene_type:complete